MKKKETKIIHERTIGSWLNAIQAGTLRLPRFQREYVWKPTNAVKLLETLIIKGHIPIGVFLVLETDSANQMFITRTIAGVSGDREETCREYLLDGQQRLTALLTSLNDADCDFRYYVEFCEYKPKFVIKLNKAGKTNNNLSQNPKKEFGRNLFPVRLLNPLEESSVVDKWTKQISPDVRIQEKAKEMILKSRNIFSKKRGESGGFRIPYFKLGRDIDRATAIDIYIQMNSNSIKLTDYYLAIANMEDRDEKSLYDVEKILNASTDIKEFETEAVGELILKVYCLLKGIIPSGGAYQKLPYGELENETQNIVDGVKWSIRTLQRLNIYDKRLLPTVVPLRVLPALYVKCNGIDETDKNITIINKYLWHSFLTDRYSVQANQKLKEDFDDLVAYIDPTKDEREFRIFESSSKVEMIDEVGWPQATAKSIIPRGILLVCCYDGAKNLKDGVNLGESNVGDRERHHVFPRTCGIDRKKLNIALNCMFIPKNENREISNKLPGDYIQALIQEVADSGETLSETQVVNCLRTHCIDQSVARDLLNVKQGKEDMILADEFNKFIKERVRAVTKRIDKLMDDGEL